MIAPASAHSADTAPAPCGAAAAASACAAHAPGIERIPYGAVAAGAAPLVSVIVPTLDGRRRGLLARLLTDLYDQTIRDFEVLLIAGDPRQGRAINRGVQAALAPVIVTMDDDTVIGTVRLLENLLQALASHPDVGMVGASTVLAPGASRLQRIASRQIPRRLFPIVDRLTDSDMVQHPCLAMRRSLFLAIGGEDEELKRGLDPLLRHKVRQAGYRVAIAAQTYISHPLPDDLFSIVRMYFRNGRGSAFAQKHYPQKIYHLTDGFEGGKLRAKVPFPLRVARYPLAMVRSLLTLRLVRLLTEAAYLCGYVREYAHSSAAPQRDTGEHSG
ncbi:MAG: hypothetical protein L0Z55_12790 [Planctomycetes bacterium]|nr:hypothetical protein [Planctomycetota bacterium]